MSQFSTLSYIVYFLTNQGLCKLTDHTKFCLIFFWAWSDQDLLIKFIDIITSLLITQKERYKSVLFIFVTFSIYNCIFLEFMLYLTRTTVLQGGLPLFYIEWRWCLWTIIILISKTLWLLVCSFWHCLRSFWRFVSNFLHRKTTPKLWLSVGWNFYFAIHWVQPLVGGCSICFYYIIVRSRYQYFLKKIAVTLK